MVHGVLRKSDRTDHSSGIVTEFSAGISADASPNHIVAGLDGNLWFTEFDGDRIGRITPSGVVSEFTAGISTVRLTWLTAAKRSFVTWRYA